MSNIKQISVQMRMLIVHQYCLTNVDYIFMPTACSKVIVLKYKSAAFILEYFCFHVRDFQKGSLTWYGCDY